MLGRSEFSPASETIASISDCFVNNLYRDAALFERDIQAKFKNQNIAVHFDGTYPED